MKDLLQPDNHKSFSHNIMKKFQISPDNDSPGNNKQFLVFKESDQYQIEGITHGKLSHAIKHYEEFDQEGMDIILNAALDYYRTIDNIFLKNVKGEILSSGKIVHQNISLNTVHNTFDFINDKIMKGIDLEKEEEYTKINFLSFLAEKYDQLIADYINNHVHEFDVDEYEINVLYNNGGKLKFNGFYENEKYTYIIDFSSSGLLVIQENVSSILTLFRIDKQGNCLNEIRTYFSRNIVVENEVLKKFLEI